MQNNKKRKIFKIRLHNVLPKNNHYDIIKTSGFVMDNLPSFWQIEVRRVLLQPLCYFFVPRE